MYLILKCISLLIISNVMSYPISQPVYPNNQYIRGQAIPSVAYNRPSAPGYVPQVQPYRQEVAPRPVYEPRAREGLQNYASYPQQPQQPIQQVSSLTGVDRQIQNAAQIGGPQYVQQIQSAQLASQAQEAFNTAQRKASSQTFNNRPIQPVPVAVATQEQPQQYLKGQQQLRYISRPAVPYNRAQQQQQESIQNENDEDYEPNPSYQFGFDVKDDLSTNYQNRKEQRDGNKITGSYSVVDSDGFIRTVQYTADPKEGFKAEVTRQPTDIVIKIPKPDPQFQHGQYPQRNYVQDAPTARGRQDQRSQPSVAYQYQ